MSTTYTLDSCRIDHPSYFQGAPADHAVGVGSTPREALADALESISCGWIVSMDGPAPDWDAIEASVLAELGERADETIPATCGWCATEFPEPPEEGDPCPSCAKPFDWGPESAQWYMILAPVECETDQQAH